MSHTGYCFRSDGDWICAAGCSHDYDEMQAAKQRRAARIEAKAKALLERLPKCEHRTWNEQLARDEWCV